MKKEQIRKALAYAGQTAAATAEGVGVSPQVFSQRTSRESWTDADLEKIAATIGAEYVCMFRFPDGVTI